VIDIATEGFDFSGGPARPLGEFYEMIDDLRSKHRWFWNERGQGYWVLTRYEDIREAFQSPELFSNESIVPVDPNPSYRFLPSLTDPPEHMKYRGPLLPWLSPRNVQRYAGFIREQANVLIDSFIDDGRVEFLGAFADQLPARLLTEIVGLPRSEAPFFIDCVQRLRDTVSAPGEQSTATTTMGTLKTYFSDVVAQRRRQPHHPDQDLLAAVMVAEIDGRPFDDEELLDLLMTLAFGSLDTTKSVMSWSFWHLATHPSDREWLVREPAIIPGALEEFLRAYPIVSMARKVTRDVEFHGCPMKKGDMVLLNQFSASRDPAAFPDAAEVKLDRSPNRHISFGASQHRCAGSHLARLELQIILEEWHRRIPVYRLADGAEPRAVSSHIDRLDLDWR